ncbi:ABC transporter ATP-binding protein [Dactylosporangium sp. CS-033363]|uniref:ABC transporter ATP-binding protein n=1 Tax=Dactylosporangium sp. CS-033363 TaxID=3239935 RepID=UPI003D93982B
MRELIAPVRARLAAAAGLQALAVAAGLVPYLAVVELARTLLGAGPADDRRVWTVVLAGAGGLVARLVLVGAATTVSHLADADLQYGLRRDLARRLGRVPLGWFGERSSGQVKQAVQDDVHALHHLVAHAALDLVGAALTPVLILGYLFWSDWRMALVTAAALPVYLLTYASMMRGYAGKLAEMNAATEAINAATVEFVEGIAVVKTFGQTGRAHRRFAAAADAFAEKFRGWVEPMTRTEALAQNAIAPTTVLTIVLAAGTGMVAADWLEPVDLLPFLLLGLGLGQPVLALGFGVGALQEAREAAGRIAAILGTPPLPVPREATEPSAPPVVEFDRVSFAYRGRALAVQDVTFKLEPGTVTALVGPSGSGKSTVARLLARFWDAGSGAVRVGGADVRAIDPARLYRTIGLVLQETTLLRMSVADNIRLGRPGASDEEVRAAAVAANIHERIEALPDGYRTVVRDGAHLSGGEAQRVTIARALLADTPILVLDEATAYADPESEAAIQDALSVLVRGRAVLVIAHRLHTITAADQILVLDGGRIAERGSHAELLETGGVYAKLWSHA